MPKTKRITINATDEVTITSSRNVTAIRIEEPHIGELLQEISQEDIATHIRSEGYKPEEIFEQDALAVWAEENGYMKE